MASQRGLFAKKISQCRVMGLMLLSRRSQQVSCPSSMIVQVHILRSHCARSELVQVAKQRSSISGCCGEGGKTICSGTGGRGDMHDYLCRGDLLTREILICWANNKLYLYHTMLSGNESTVTSESVFQGKKSISDIKKTAFYFEALDLLPGM